MNRRDEILARIAEVPALPPAAARAIAFLKDPDADIADVKRAIEYDPGLATNLLHLANSVYFGGANGVSSVRDAIVRLGFHRTFQLVLAATVGPIARRPIKGYDIPAGQLWEHSVFVAVCGETLAAELGVRPPDHTFTAGLLHDLGKIVLGTFLEIDPEPILTLAFETPMSFDEAEREVLGIDHAAVGAALLQQWNLPDEIAEVVRAHHRPEEFLGDPLVVDLVHVANLLSMESGIGGGVDGLNYRPCEQSAVRLKFEPHVAEKVICDVVDVLEELQSLFDMTSEQSATHGA